MEFPQWISSTAENLIRKMLNPDPDKRIDIKSIKTSRIYQRGKELTENKIVQSKTNKIMITIKDDLFNLKKPRKIEKEKEMEDKHIKTDINIFRKANSKDKKTNLKIHKVNIQEILQNPILSTRTNNVLFLSNMSKKKKPKIKEDNTKENYFKNVVTTTTNSPLRVKANPFTYTRRENPDFPKLVIPNCKSPVGRLDKIYINLKTKEDKPSINLDILSKIRSKKNNSQTKQRLDNLSIGNTKRNNHLQLNIFTEPREVINRKIIRLKNNKEGMPGLTHFKASGLSVDKKRINNLGILPSLL
ncbi:MAG: hypothetical protein MJ252_26780 [archaeon]|nr:hypothetical protein [archaeon]